MTRCGTELAGCRRPRRGETTQARYGDGGARPRGHWLSYFVLFPCAVLLAGALPPSAARAQDGVSRPHVRTIFLSAREAYGRGDYDTAAQLLAQIDDNARQLSQAEQRDYQDLYKQTNIAMNARHSGSAQLRQAEEALARNQVSEAAALARALVTNQYLAPPEKDRLQQLTDRLRAAGVSTPGNVSPMKEDAKSLLVAARGALQRGDLDKAEALARQAEKVATGLPYWMQPWNDNPSKVLRDVQAARIRQIAAQEPPRPPEKQESGSPLTAPFRAIGRLFSSSPAPAENAAPENKPAPEMPRQGTANSGLQVASGPAAGQLQRTTDYTPAPQGNGSDQDNSPAGQVLRKGREALARGDFGGAQQCAIQARSLGGYSWWHDTPDKLLGDIQARATGAPVAPVSPYQPTGNGQPVVGGSQHVEQASVRPPESSPRVATRGLAADPRALLREGRILFKEGNLDEADRLSLRAAAVPGTRWGLFEDSPDKLRIDIQKARGRKDRDEAKRLLVEARQALERGNLQEARAKAYRAKILHGPYSMWEFGDRPDRLLIEINTAETKQPRRSEGPDPYGQNTVAQGPNQGAGQQTAGQSGNRPTDQAPPMAAVEARQRAQALLAEARALQQRGMLVDARQKALDAHKWGDEAARGGVVFTPAEDSPDRALFDLARQAETRIHDLVRRAEDEAVGGSKNPLSLKRAAANLADARQLAGTFRLDAHHIDAATATLQRVQQLASGTPPTPGVTGNPDVKLAGGQPTGPNADLRNEGLAKLDKARLEREHGALGAARRLAEAVYIEKQYDLKAEAGAFLNSLDVEEERQRCLETTRKFDAALDAFARRDFALTRTIIAGLDIQLLDPQRQGRLREISSSAQLQPGQPVVQQVADQQLSGPGVGRAVVEMPPGGKEPQGPGGVPDSMASFKAMEKLQLDQLRSDWMQVQTNAQARVKAGNYDAALDLAREFNERLEESKLSPGQVAALKRQVEGRIDQFRKLKEEAKFIATREADRFPLDARERERQRVVAQQKRDTEIDGLIKQCNALMREGRYDKALPLAYQARELDPDNLAADMAIGLAKIHREVQKQKAQSERKQDYFLKATYDAEEPGPWVDLRHPVDFDADVLKQNRNRQSFRNGISYDNRGERERAIERKVVEMKTSLNIKDMPLDKVIDTLRAVSGLNVVADVAALDEAGINRTQQMSLEVEQVSLRSILNMLLKQARLTYVVKDEVLQITTEDAAKGKSKVVTYPVADLVVPVENHPLPTWADIHRIFNGYYEKMPNYGGGVPNMYNNAMLPNGQPVGTPGGQGHGGNAGPNKGVPSTIEDVLIRLITNTIEPQSWHDQGGKGTIQYFPIGLALVINQTPDIIEQISDLLAALRRLQDLEVAIEMRLVSVSESFFERLGMDFDINIVNNGQTRFEQQLLTNQFRPPGFINKFVPDTFFSGLTPAGTFTPDLGIPLKNSSFDFSLPPFGGYPGTLGADGGLTLGLAFLSDIQVFMLIEAAQGDRRANVMQAPKITVFNGQTAFIQVGDAQFFLTTIQPQQFGSQLVFQPQNSPIPIQVALQVTPVVSADRRFVRLNLSPQLSNLVSANVPMVPFQFAVPDLFFDGFQSIEPRIFQMFFQQPAFGTISLNTTVVIPDGGTVLLGGFKALAEARNEFGPPILSKIPYINRLFKNVGYGRDTSSLMVLVTARIIINEEEEQIFLGQLPPIPR